MPKFRQSMRLRQFDYEQPGYYFITACVHDRTSIFGECLAGVMHLNTVGKLIDEAWRQLPSHYDDVELDLHVVMPNHFHGILVLNEIDEQNGRRHGLPELMRAFKSFSARKVNRVQQTLGKRVWQRGYYEHIIRNEADYMRIAEYIESNPAKWDEDSLNPENVLP